MKWKKTEFNKLKFKSIRRKIFTIVSIYIYNKRLDILYKCTDFDIGLLLYGALTIYTYYILKDESIINIYKARNYCKASSIMGTVNRVNVYLLIKHLYVRWISHPFYKGSKYVGGFWNWNVWEGEERKALPRFGASIRPVKNQDCNARKMCRVVGSDSM